MGASAVIAGGAVVGSYVEMQGNRQAAKDQQAALEERARLKRAQARDVMKRFDMNRNIMRREGKRFGAEQESAFVAGGVSSGGATLQALENNIRETAEQIKLEKFESEAKAESLMAGADVDIATGRRIRKAERAGRVGSIINGVTQVAGAF